MFTALIARKLANEDRHTFNYFKIDETEDTVNIVTIIHHERNY